MKKLISKIFKRDPVDHAGEIDPKYVEEAKLAFRERKRVIDEWVDNYHKEYRAVHQPILDALVKEKEHNNSVCPKCGSKNIVNNYIKQKFNVFEYNHCNDCTHEWKREKIYCPFVDVNEEAKRVAHMLDMIVLDIYNLTYDPMDIGEEYDSLDEKQKSKAEKYLNDKHWGPLLEMPLEILYHFGYKYASELCNMTEEVFGKDLHYAFDNNYELYAGKFTTKMEDILINKLNVKKMF